MTPERWQQVKTALAEALDCPGETERAAFLASACAGDTALRREVQSLLDQPPDEFDCCADTVGLANSDELVSTNVGRRVGAYVLERELGRGGMGTVWLARRADQQFEKLAAVKLLKRGTDTDEVLRRFHGERQILARLEHPNIARLLDGGTTDDGLPYFVLEYVEGTRVTDFVREQQLSVPRTLELFLKICGAVQFAHQNLVVHRDLKPGNILVTREAEPKLLDFGIAKLLGPSEASWEMTMAGRERLTPGYASPEQVRGEPVTTVSDVYSLGALLYELLTGQPPHRFSSEDPAPTQILRVVCEEEPRRPSSVARTPEIRRQLRGDLDTIVLRAVSKTPERRYRGAGQLADDLRRYLQGRPVKARPDTVGYRTRKFLQRNKLAATAAALLLLTLLGGVIATRHETLVAQAERAKAERRFNEVRKIANSFIFEVHNSIAELPGALAARQLITRRAVEYLDGLADEAGADLSLKGELATAYRHIGLLTFKIRDAIASHKKAVALDESLVAAVPKNVAFRKELSAAYDDLSDVMKIAGHSSDAIRYAGKALTVMQALVREAPNDRSLRAGLAGAHAAVAVTLLDAGDAKKALEQELRALDIYDTLVAQDDGDREALRARGSIYGRMSEIYHLLGDVPSALEFSRRQLNVAEQNHSAEPESARLRRDLWSAHLNVARELAATGDAAGARRSFDGATELMEQLSAADPGDEGHRRWLAVTYFRAGAFLQAEQPDEALRRYEKGIALSEKIAADDPDRAEVRSDLAEMNDSLGTLLMQMGQTKQALARLTKGTAFAEELLKSDPRNDRVRADFAQLCATTAAAYRQAATQPNAPGAERATNLGACSDWCRRSLESWQQVERNGNLNATDAAKPAEVAQALADCATGAP